MKDLRLLIATLCFFSFALNATAQNWLLTGNAGTNASTNFIGTTDAKSFKVRTNNSVRMFISSTGNVGIGTTSPSTKLHVNGDVTANGNVGIPAVIPGARLGVTESVAGNYAGYFTTSLSGKVAFTAVYANGNVAGGYGNGIIGNGGHSGVTGMAQPGDTTGYGVYGQGVGISTSSSCKIYGVYGLGENFYGAGVKYGVCGIAHDGGPNAPAYGVYGDASGTENFWAGYFAGKTHVASLHVGTEREVTDYKVVVDGKVICEELKVQNSANWPDYVFSKDYRIPTLYEVEQNININGHLQGIPGACEAEEQGVSVGEMQKKLLEKIEELTLYVIQQNKRVETLEKDNAYLKALIEK